jgi:hypothetical protein
MTLRDDPPPSRDGAGTALRTGEGTHCGARSRSDGICCSPPLPNGRCRNHGGLSTGPRTAEGLARMRKAKTRHGLHAQETMALRRAVRMVRAGHRAVRGAR